LPRAAAATSLLETVKLQVAAAFLPSRSGRAAINEGTAMNQTCRRAAPATHNRNTSGPWLRERSPTCGDRCGKERCTNARPLFPGHERRTTPLIRGREEAMHSDPAAIDYKTTFRHRRTGENGVLTVIAVGRMCRGRTRRRRKSTGLERYATFVLCTQSRSFRPGGNGGDNARAIDRSDLPAIVRSWARRSGSHFRAPCSAEIRPLPRRLWEGVFTH